MRPQDSTPIGTIADEALALIAVAEPLGSADDEETTEYVIPAAALNRLHVAVMFADLRAASAERAHELARELRDAETAGYAWDGNR